MREKMYNGKKQLDRIFLYGLLLLTFLPLLGCSPVAWDAKKVFENRWEEAVENKVVKVKKFKKVYSRHEALFSNEEQIYVVEFEAELECLKDVDPSERDNELCKNHKKGEIVKEEGQIFFKKTDQGWIHYGTKIFHF